MVLEKTPESPLDSKEIKLVNPKGNQPLIFIESTDAEAPILWPPDVKTQFNGKDPDAGKDWGQEEKGTDRGWDGWMASPTQWTWVWVNSRRWWWTRKPGILCKAHGIAKSWMQLSDWTTINFGASLVIQWLRFWAPNAVGLSSILGQGTRSHILQLKILHATTKTWCTQINEWINKYFLTEYTHFTLYPVINHNGKYKKRRYMCV